MDPAMGGRVAGARSSSAAFETTALVAGLLSLALYACLPVWAFSEGGMEALGIQALWLVPSAVVLVGLVFRSRLFGRIAILAGALLLTPMTMFFSLMLLGVVMLGAEVSLIAIGMGGLIAAGRVDWSRRRWLVLLAGPAVVAGALQIVIVLFVWPNLTS